MASKSVKVPEGCGKAYAMRSTLGVSRWALTTREDVEEKLAVIHRVARQTLLVRVVPVAIVPLDGRFTITPTKAGRKGRRKS